VDTPHLLGAPTPSPRAARIAGTGASDATPAIAAALADGADAWPEAHRVATDETGYDMRAVALIRTFDMPPQG
jgi:hypothetical protein